MEYEKGKIPGKGMKRPVGLLCSRNARPQKALVGRAQGETKQAAHARESIERRSERPSDREPRYALDFAVDSPTTDCCGCLSSMLRSYSNTDFIETYTWTF